MSRAGAAWQRWKKIAHRAAEIQSNVLLFGMYFVLVVPASLLFRRRSRGGSQGWQSIPEVPAELDSARHQF